MGREGRRHYPLSYWRPYPAIFKQYIILAHTFFNDQYVEISFLLLYLCVSTYLPHFNYFIKSYCWNSLQGETFCFMFQSYWKQRCMTQDLQTVIKKDKKTRRRIKTLQTLLIMWASTTVQNQRRKKMRVNLCLNLFIPLWPVMALCKLSIVITEEETLHWRSWKDCLHHAICQRNFKDF